MFFLPLFEEVLPVLLVPINLDGYFKYFTGYHHVLPEISNITLAIRLIFSKAIVLTTDTPIGTISEENNSPGVIHIYSKYSKCYLKPCSTLSCALSPLYVLKFAPSSE